MEGKNERKTEKKGKNTGNRAMTRKEALVKAGKYAAFTAAGMMMILSPKRSQAGSELTDPGWNPYGGL